MNSRVAQESVESRKNANKKIAIVGAPNVGKSVMFNNLTGMYVTVSNYPGTTVEISRGKGRIADEEYEIIDTPGMYSFLPITEEERIGRKILLEEFPDILLHMTDAKNIEKALGFTLQLSEAGLPVILVLNMIDEALRAGKEINLGELENELHLPVVATVSVTGYGIPQLKEKIGRYSKRQPKKISYENSSRFSVEDALEKIGLLLKSDNYTISKRAAGLLFLQEDADIEQLIRNNDNESFVEIKKITGIAKQHCSHPLEYEIVLRRQKEVNRIIGDIFVSGNGKKKEGFRERLSRITMNPLTGIPILIIVLYLGLYKFVGGFGAGTLVDFLESTVFEKYINPAVTSLFITIIPWKIIQDLFVGEYGIITLGVRYAVAIILPIVTMFFIVFSIIEDTGYLPRLAMLIDRIFKKIGLSGRAVIPMVLGLGCDTMATMVTRTLPSRKERILSTILLALAIPCSAQLGVIIALLENKGLGLLIWGMVISFVFLFVGFISARLLPGEAPVFYMDIPPLRFPQLSNILVKTYSRVKWYFKEIFPIFILASVFIWIGQVTGVFDFLVSMLKPAVRLIGLPQDAARIFLFGFFRRDYGAAGLYDLNKAGTLTGVQLVVACIALTLFLPCIAQFLINIKERGIKTGLGISVFILIFSFGTAFIVNTLLINLGVSL